MQNLILLCATVAVLSNVKKASPKARLFWSLLGLGLGMWLVSQVMWTYLEVYVRHEVPNPFVGGYVPFANIYNPGFALTFFPNYGYVPQPYFYPVPLFYPQPVFFNPMMPFGNPFFP